MKQIDPDINSLSERLQADVLALNGKSAAPARVFHREQLLPLAVIAGMALLVGLMPKARRKVLLKATLLAATRLMQGWIATSLV